MPIRPYSMATAMQCAALNFADAPGWGWVSVVTLAAKGSIRTSIEAMSATGIGLPRPSSSTASMAGCSSDAARSSSVRCRRPSRPAPVRPPGKQRRAGLHAVADRRAATGQCAHEAADDRRLGAIFSVVGLAALLLRVPPIVAVAAAITVGFIVR